MSGLFAAWLVVSPVGAEQGPDTAPEAPGISIVEIPIDVDLAPLFAYMERHIPRRVGVMDRWEKFRNVLVQYGIQRGPVRSRMAADRLQLALPLAYWVRARKSLAKVFKVNGSCGVDEPPRIVFVHLDTVLRWGRDWNVLSKTRVLPSYFVNPCLMTFADLDVTPLIERQLENKLVKFAQQSIDANVPRLSNIRPKAQKAWTAMQTPIELDESIWLLLRPETVSVGPLLGKGARLQTSVAVTARPRLIFGARPTVPGRPLPALRVSRRPASGIHLQLEGELRYDELRSELKTRLTKVLHHYAGDAVRLERVDISTEDQNLVIALETAHPLRIRLRLTGRPAYSVARREIFLEDFAMKITSDDTVSEIAADWLRGNLQQDMQRYTAWPVSGPLRTVVERLEQDLGRRLPGEVSIDTQITGIQFRPIHSSPERLKLLATLDASVRLQIGE